MKSAAFSVAVLALASCATAPVQHANLPAPRAAPSDAALAAAPLLQPTATPWVEHPSARDYMAVYPVVALHNGQNGAVLLECLVETDYRLACAVREERPAAAGFGEAARRVSPLLRVAPTLANGQPTRGGKLLWQVDFNSTGRTALTGHISREGVSAPGS